MDSLPLSVLTEICALSEEFIKTETLDTEECEASLSTYLERAWNSFESSSYAGNWHIDAIAEHLEAVSYGQIRRLIINIPPRHGKTNLVAVAWPTWTWAQKPDPDYPLIGPQVRFLCASYGAKKAQEDGVTARRLIASEWYQKRWGNRLIIAKDRDNQERYDTTAGGSRISTGIPESLGKGGLIRILDDPHKTNEVESDLQREAVIRAYREVWSTRSNDATLGAEVLIMQRLAENDLTGYLLSSAEDVVHLNLPAEYDPSRHCETVIGFSDPRTIEGEALWPEKCPPEWLREHATKVGPYAYAAQYQQSPQPRGGGIIKYDYWQEWDRDVFPDFDLVVASLDTAVTAKEESDYSALVVLGMWRDQRDAIVWTDDKEAVPRKIYEPAPKIMLMYGWQERLPINDLVKKVIATCAKFKVDTLIIENKAHGHAVQQEIFRMTSGRRFSVRMNDPSRQGDKMARLLSVQHLFAEGLVFAPFKDGFAREWADQVMMQTAAFPRGAHDDYVDALSQGLRFLRNIGVAMLKDEHAAESATLMQPPQKMIPLYPA